MKKLAQSSRNEGVYYAIDENTEEQFVIKMFKNNEKDYKNEKEKY